MSLTVPSLIPNLPEDDYFSHPALSASGAKRLLPPSCPALFKWEQEHGRPDTQAFDIGHVFHSEVLGTGREVEILQTDVKKATKTTPAVIGDAKNRMSNYTKDHDKEIRDAGKVPLLREEYEQVKGMVASVRSHPIAARLLDPDLITPEASGFWHDDRFGVNRRMRLDALPAASSGRLIVPDLKSTVSACPDTFGKKALDYGYAGQDAWYSDGIRALGLDDDPAFVFVLVEKTAPYLVSVVQLDETAKRYGRRRNDLALEIFRDCTEAGVWPGYSPDDIPTVSLPTYATRELEYA